eukprot:SAG11_NODE_38_length_21705_cov_24.667453_1_plen_550_part_00
MRRDRDCSWRAEQMAYVPPHLRRQQAHHGGGGAVAQQQTSASAVSVAYQPVSAAVAWHGSGGDVASAAAAASGGSRVSGRVDTRVPDRVQVAGAVVDQKVSAAASWHGSGQARARDHHAVASGSTSGGIALRGVFEPKSNDYSQIVVTRIEGDGVDFHLPLDPCIEEAPAIDAARRQLFDMFVPTTERDKFRLPTRDNGQKLRPHLSYPHAARTLRAGTEFRLRLETKFEIGQRGNLRVRAAAVQPQVSRGLTLTVADAVRRGVHSGRSRWGGVRRRPGDSGRASGGRKGSRGSGGEGGHTSWDGNAEQLTAATAQQHAGPSAAAPTAASTAAVADMTAVVGSDVARGWGRPNLADPANAPTAGGDCVSGSAHGTFPARVHGANAAARSYPDDLARRPLLVLDVNHVLLCRQDQRHRARDGTATYQIRPHCGAFLRFCEGHFDIAVRRTTAPCALLGAVTAGGGRRSGHAACAQTWRGSCSSLASGTAGPAAGSSSRGTSGTARTCGLGTGGGDRSAALAAQRWLPRAAPDRATLSAPAVRSARASRCS